MRVSNREKRVARWRPAVWMASLRERSAGRRSAFLLQEIEALQQQLAESETAHRQLRDKYREATNLHREQRGQLLRLRVAEQLFEAGVGLSADDDAGTSALARLLRLVMETVEAGGGVLWMRAETGNKLVPQVCEGRIGGAAPLENSSIGNIRNIESILRVDTLSPSELRARCEKALQWSAPVAPRPAYSRRSAQTIPASLLTNEAVVSTHRVPVPASEAEAVAAAFGAVAFRELQAVNETEFETKFREVKKESESASPSVAILTLRADESGAILGVVGVCDPRGQSRFTSVERERLQSLSHPLTAALRNVLQRADANRRLNEHLNEMANGLPDDMLVRHDRDAEYQNIVSRVMQTVPCENCTLFLLDATGQRLEARATRGHVVDLLDHIGFARGHGVSGWVAAQGRPLHIADLTQEPGLLPVETTPPPVRSFLAVPLRADGDIVGVLNVSHARAYAFSPDDVRLLSSLADQAAQTI